jgi:hypothetical protein
MSLVVVVSKKHPSADITHTVRHIKGSIAIEMDLDAFIKVLVKETKMFPFFFTKKWLLSKLTDSAKRVIDDMKESSIHGG